MLVLFETAAGYSLFKVSNEKKLDKTDPADIHDEFFATSEKAQKSLELVNFQPFEDTAQAVAATTSLMEGQVHSSLKSFLKKPLKKKDSICIADKALASSLKDAIKGANVLSDAKTAELFRGIRCHVGELLEDKIAANDYKAMQLGLSHSLGRYKLKFSSDKVDTMVIQAVGLLDELDKEINTYAMRVKEWYGWHFPELQALVGDNATYSKLVLECGIRTEFRKKDLSAILEDESQEAAIKEAAEVSMGTEIAEIDIIHMSSLASQVLSLTEYRSQLWEYLKNRMNAIAPNLTIIVGELVGARLISHAGSLLNLAKQPASTVQILGAEKALFRALKTKHDTPKYGLIYHASLIGQAAPKHKGKVSRVLAAKAALAIRVDALSDDVTPDTTIGFEGRAKIEARLRQLETNGQYTPNKNLKARTTSKYDPVAAKTAANAPSYNDASDMVLSEEKEKKSEKKKKKDKKRKSSDDDEEEEEVKSAKKKKKRKSDDMEEEAAEEKEEKKSAKKAKKKKRKSSD